MSLFLVVIVGKKSFIIVTNLWIKYFLCPCGPRTTLTRNNNEFSCRCLAARQDTEWKKSKQISKGHDTPWFRASSCQVLLSRVRNFVHCHLFTPRMECVRVFCLHSCAASSSKLYNAINIFDCQNSTTVYCYLKKTL